MDGSSVKRAATRPWCTRPTSRISGELALMDSRRGDVLHGVGEAAGPVRRSREPTAPRGRTGSAQPWTLWKAAGAPRPEFAGALATPVSVPSAPCN
jgi:hypothetical protein